MPSVACTSSGAAMFGKTWRPSMRKVEAPRARAASTNSSSATCSVEERASRAYCGTYTMPSASMRFVMLGPSTVVIAIAKMIDGNASITSIAPMSTLSAGPRKYPAATPIAVPATMATPTATNPMATETRAPKSIRAKTSRPSLSVPNKWCRLGGTLPSWRSCASGS